MPEEGAGDPQAGDGADPKGGGGANPDPKNTPDPKSGEGKGAGSEDPRVAEARNEAIEERHKRQETEAELKKLKDAQLSDEEKREARTKELEAENATLKANEQAANDKVSIMEAARKAGAHDLELAIAAVDRSKIERDDAGNPKNLDKLIEAAKEKHPVIFGSTPGASADGGARGTAGDGSGDMNARIRRASGRT